MEESKAGIIKPDDKNRSNDQLSDNEEEVLQKWYKKRRYNLYVYTVCKCLYGFEYSAISISALYYFQYIIRVSNPKLYYSAAIGALFVSPVISSSWLGRYVDRSRNLRGAALCVACFNFAGNVIYVLPFVSWLPILGRFICGIAEGIDGTYQGKVSYSCLLFKSRN